MAAVGAYPGTFNPPTVAHLAIAEAARQQGGLTRLDLLVSRQPLGKDPAQPPLERRLEVLDAIATTRPWLGVRVTDQQLIADLAAGYDAVVARRRQVAADQRPGLVRRLPLLPRSDPGAPAPPAPGAPPSAHPARPLPPGAVVLDVDRDHQLVSSTEARAGRRDWMAPEANAAGWWHDRRERAD